MALKILHPKKNAKHKQKLIVIQGKCDNAQKVTGVLVNKGTGAQVPGQKLGNNKKWGFAYKNLSNGSYKFTVSQTNSPVITDDVDFDVSIPATPPPSGIPPTVTSPADSEEVAASGFFPYGTSASDVSLTFAGNGQSTTGTVTQQPDSDGNWTGQVDGIDTWPAGGGYQFAATNSAGTTNVSNLSIAAP